jgi:hypothetical protein
MTCKRIYQALILSAASIVALPFFLIATPAHAQVVSGQTEAGKERAVLYNKDPADDKGRQFVGSATWRTEPVKVAGKPDDIVVRAEVEIPTADLKMSMVIRRNLSPALPATHTIEIRFQPSATLGGGGIQEAPGVLMKPDEVEKGIPLRGLSVPVSAGFFLVGLSNVEADREENLKSLQENETFDVPIVYKNKQRAILAIHKGESGDKAFKSAFAAWGK